MRHDLSPAMLKSFLRIRAEYLAMAGTYVSPKGSALRAAKVQLRQLAGVTREEFHAAWMGLLLEPEPRVKLWSALDVSPHLLDLRLTYGGQEDLRPAASDTVGESEMPG